MKRLDSFAATACRHCSTFLSLILLAMGLVAGSVRAEIPPNDTCDGAEVVPGDGPFPYLTPLIPDISEATILGDPGEPSCIGESTRSVWFSFTPAQSGLYKFSLGGETATTLEDSVMAIYSSANGCVGPFTELECNDDAGLGSLALRSALLLQLNAGTKYFIVVWSLVTPLPDQAAVQLAVSRPMIPSNDTCAGAEAIPGAGPFPHLTSVVDTLLATEAGDPPLPSCKNPDFNKRSTWYVFTPATTSVYTLTTRAGTMTQMYDNTMAIYTSANGCAGPFVEFACSGVRNQREEISAILTGGTSYYIVVWDTEQQAIISESDLQLQVTIPPQAFTLAATGITSTGAVVNATVKPNGLRTFYWFEYGTNNSYGNRSAVRLLSATITEAAVNAALENLVASQLYHYRVVATNVNGTALGEDRTFLWSAARPDLEAPALAMAGGSLQFQFQFTGQSFQVYKVDMSTNLIDWTEWGEASEVGLGSFRFADPASPPSKARFYRVRSP